MCSGSFLLSCTRVIKTSLTLPFGQIQITVLFESPAISPHKCFHLIACFVYGSTHCLARRAQMSSAPSSDWELLPEIDALDTHNKEHLSADRLVSLNRTSTEAFSALRPFRESIIYEGLSIFSDAGLIERIKWALHVGLNKRCVLRWEAQSDFSIYKMFSDRFRLGI